MSGTSVSAATAWYLGGNTGSNTTSSTILPLKQTGPTATTLFNYDTNRDSAAGLLLAKGTSQAFNYSVGSTPLTLTGTSSLRIWAALASGTSASATVSVGLYDCDSTGTTCNQLVTNSSTWTATNSLTSRTIPIVTTAGTYTWVAGRSLQVQVSVPNGQNPDMVIAYDTTTYKSAILIQ